jgi:two-component system phosphate regulon sensor histidine kinase PhoR
MLAIVSVVGIIVTQIYWLNKAFEVQENQYNLVLEQEAFESKLFNDRITIALTNVANEILTINNDPAKTFQSVKQIRPNYFTVAINDTVHPYLLESLLKSEFENRNIVENFEYGIYDCFTDSIVFGEYISLNDDSTLASSQTAAPQIKWDKDGHYFGVYFPDRKVVDIKPLSDKVSTWAFSAIISLIVFVFFAYAVYIVLRQKRLDEMKTDFINNMTHELKTPISTIGLSSEVLLNDDIGNQPDRLKRYAQLIADENKRLQNQVDKVLQLATLNKEQIDLRKERLDLHEIIKVARSSVLVSQSNSNPNIELRLKAENSIISGDPVHINNVVYNLLDNAMKYSGDDVKIEIETLNKKGRIVLKVTDYGIGIPKKSIPYIFDKFYRVPKGNVHDVKGFGLGLYYVNQMVKAHHGTISVSSEMGSWTTFEVDFPSAKKIKE